MTRVGLHYDKNHPTTATSRARETSTRARRRRGDGRRPMTTLATRCRAAVVVVPRARRPASTTARVVATAAAARDDEDDDDDDAATARAIDASIEEMKTLAEDEVEEMMSANEGVRAELARVRRDARGVVARELERAEANEKERVREAFEEAQERTGEAQSKAERAAEEALALKRDAVTRAEAKISALRVEREALREELARDEGEGSGKWADGGIDEAVERVESVKAAVVAGAGGGALAAPLLVSQGGGTAAVGAAALSCAAFGVTYRYAVRRDVENSELKGGVVGAFGLARGLSAADVYLRAASLEGDLDVASYAQAALLAGQGVLTFAFAALALEQAFERGIVKPFGVASEDAR
jgi:hypothetical protein